LAATLPGQNTNEKRFVAVSQHTSDAYQQLSPEEKHKLKEAALKAAKEAPNKSDAESAPKRCKRVGLTIDIIVRQVSLAVTQDPHLTLLVATRLE
jgi:hypothetical protein